MVVLLVIKLCIAMEPIPGTSKQVNENKVERFSPFPNKSPTNLTDMVNDRTVPFDVNEWWQSFSRSTGTNSQDQEILDINESDTHKDIEELKKCDIILNHETGEFEYTSDTEIDLSVPSLNEPSYSSNTSYCILYDQQAGNIYENPVYEHNMEGYEQTDFINVESVYPIAEINPSNFISEYESILRDLD